MAKYILKKDIIIPSGTVFTIAPTDTVRVGDVLEMFVMFCLEACLPLTNS